MTDVLVQLPTLSWRGIWVPVTNRSVSFSQELAEQKFSYRDNAFMESLGAKNISFNYSIPFREDIAKGPYENLFIDVFPKFLAACRDRSAGVLMDPVLGQYSAKCTQFSSTLNPNARDGLDVDVSFIYAPAIDEAEFLPDKIDGITELDNQAGLLDANVAKADFNATILEAETGGVVTTNRQEAPPKAFQDLLGQIDGFGRQIERFGNKIDSSLSSVAFKLEQMEETISVLQNPKNWPLQRSSRRLRGAIANVSLKVAYPGKEVLTYNVNFDISIGDLAANVGMTTGAFLALNPTVALTPTVPSGSQVLYLVDSGSSIAAGLGLS